MKNILKKIRFFKIIKEIQYFKKYVQNVKKFENSIQWKNFKTTRSKFYIFGLIVKVSKEKLMSELAKGYSTDIAQKRVINDEMVDFLDDMKDCGLVSSLISTEINLRENESNQNLDFYFYEVIFSFYWQYLTIKYVISRLLILFFIISLFYFKWVNIFF